MKNSKGNNRVDTPSAIVVEDELTISIICDRVLSGEGFKVQTVSDGYTAQKLIQRYIYDLYLFDIRLPGINGKDLYKWLVGNQVLDGAIVIFMTGDLMTTDTQQFLRETGRAYLQKPFTPQLLQDTVREQREAKGSE